MSGGHLTSSGLRRFSDDSPPRAAGTRAGGVTRYWVSWWSDNPINAETSFEWWDTGMRFNMVPQESYVGVIDADSEDAAWMQVLAAFPDYVHRFIEEKPADWTPGDRFR